jgi:hypothetical protein
MWGCRREKRNQHFAVACRVEEPKEEREVDGSGQVYMTVAELQEQEAKRRAGMLPVQPALECHHMVSGSLYQRSIVITLAG